ncbi:hypothetical protein MHK_010030 [Candidatus Magnetomorum sp. HK-1]|nr:hypothetical protein MHK_010030 [Candidatus Magnetomorum sp. HK-1]
MNNTTSLLLAEVIIIILIGNNIMNIYVVQESEWGHEWGQTLISDLFS